MSSHQFTDRMLEAILADMKESERLKALSNKELVAECLQRNHTDCLVVDEMMNRLWPNWANEEP